LCNQGAGKVQRKKGVNAAKAASAQASGKFSGSFLGSVTGVDMRHLLLLLPFLYLIFWMTKYTITMRKIKALSLSILSMN
jgi:hypothetical protein